MQQRLEELAGTLMLGACLNRLREWFGSPELVAHWQQGEFHHDLVFRVPPGLDLPASVLVISTNCNGGIKEVLCLDEVPDRWALWHHRCPDNPDFTGSMPRVVASARTIHWFDPCELLSSEARSELKPEFRQRQRGGGWVPSRC